MIARPEFFLFRLEVVVVDRSGKVFRSFGLPLDKRFVDHHLGCDIGEFTPLRLLHLFPHGLEISLHAVDTDRDAIDQGERLRVFGQHSGDNVADLAYRLVWKRGFKSPSWTSRNFGG
jgi:hypothetical protein